MALSACRCALPEADLELLLAPASRTVERFQLEVEIESSGLAGTFDAVLVARPSPPAMRLQLLPPLGTPILDVVATPDGITGFLHGDSAPRTWRGGADDPPPGLLLFLGITLLEQHAEITRARVVAAHAGTPPRLHLRGSFPGVAIADAEVAGGRLVACTLAYGPVRWRQHSGPPGGSVDAPGFTLRARVRERETATDVGDAIFALDGVR